MDITKFQNNFKEKVYKPYTQAWQIVKTLKEADLTKEEVWDGYFKECEKFRKEYPSEFGASIYRVLLDAGDEAKRSWNEM